MTESESSKPGLFVASVCEFMGTFCLVLIGTGAIIIDHLTNGGIGHVGVSLCFGIVVCVVIYSIGHLSGAHINPAVTIGFFATGEIGIARLLSYIFSQVAGALAASVLMNFLFSSPANLGATAPNMDISGVNIIVVCLVLEFLLTFVLMWVILAMTSPTNPNPSWTGLVVGAVIAMEALAAGPICGASMNPARSIGPALASLQLTHLWIYLLAPVSGALAASLIGPLVLGRRIPEGFRQATGE